jgi:signal transduction histidine kinase
MHLEQIKAAASVSAAYLGCSDEYSYRQCFAACEPGDPLLGDAYIAQLVRENQRQYGRTTAFCLPSKRHGLIYRLERRSIWEEYVLVCDQRVLCEEQRIAFEQQASLFQAHLDLHRDYFRQRTAIESLEQILHQLGHQLRQPLAIASLFTENLRLSLEGSVQQDQVCVVSEALAQLDELCSDLLNGARRTELVLKERDLGSLFESALVNLKPLIEVKQLRIVRPETSPSLPVDPFQMRQVFENLLRNGIAFSPPEGTIELRWRVFSREILIELADQGPGLSDEDLQNLFKPYYSRRPGGTGLGLSIVRKIVLDHRGRLWAENLKSGGALLSIALPRLPTPNTDPRRDRDP